MPDERLNDSIDPISFVDREATPEFLMKLCIQLYLSYLSILNVIRFFIYLVSNALGQLFITGFTMPIYKSIPGRIRITLRLMRR
jgi:hypothetical protein